MTPHMNQAHARFERAMAELKSMNLDLPHQMVAITVINSMSDVMSDLADRVEVWRDQLAPYHRPADPAPNPVTQGAIE